MSVDETAKANESHESQDYTNEVVPMEKRRGPVILALLWITMVTGFPSVLAGVDWYRNGLNLTQSILLSLLSSSFLLAYTVPACMMGARSGQTYSLLSRTLFGKLGSRLVSFNLAWIAIGWYGLTASFLADGIMGLFPIPIHKSLLSAIFAIVMAFNNYFGFSGVANFAGYFAAPVLILWVFISFAKASLACPTAALFAAPTQSWQHGLTVVSAFVIGYGAWGNEADFWRFSKPKMSHIVIPLVASILIGQIIFPLTGWMLARNTGITNYGAASELMTQYAFGGISAIAAVVLFVTYCALNDANLYAVINAVENLHEFPRKKLVLVLTLIGAVVAVFLSEYGQSFEAVASISSVILPCATVIMLSEWFVVSRFTGQKPDFSRVLSFDEIPLICRPAVTGLIGGSIVGVVTAGIIPGLESLHVGVSAIQAWAVSVAIYLPMRLHAISRERIK